MQNNLQTQRNLSRRDFLKYSTTLTIFSYLQGCDSGGSQTSTSIVSWPISQTVYTTEEQQIVPVALAANTTQINPNNLSAYVPLGYTAWQATSGLPHTLWKTIAPNYTNAGNKKLLLSFFTISDIHIADKESPAQPLYVGWSASYGASGMQAAYSPILLATTQVLDAAVQTINALHKKSPFDFGISLGDAANNTQYNELRWYIDVIDGKVITPSSGANLGANINDYQKPYQAAGLDKTIPWYQVIGNHDQFWMGSFFENAKTLAAHTSDTVINTGPGSNPLIAINQTGYYMGVINGLDPLGAVIKSGPEQNFTTPPTVVADANRHSLASATSTTQNWINEFFNTSSSPVGHGFNFVDKSFGADFACYSFLPKLNLPIKIIVLDDTCKGAGQPDYAAGSLDQQRLDWLKGELQAGQDKNQLMIIAAHIPFQVYQNLVTDPSQVATNPAISTQFIQAPTNGATSVVSDASLLAVLQNYPNLILWIAGHRHMNTITPQIHPTDPTRSFWEVETSSLRDFPQQFRTFKIYSNNDNTISIKVTNVDPAVYESSPATTSRGNAVASARIFTNIASNDTTSHSINAELVVQLSTTMQGVIANL